MFNMAKKVKLAASLEVANTLSSNWTDHCTFYAGPGEDEKGEVVILGSSFTAGPVGVNFYKGALTISPDGVRGFGTAFSVGPNTVDIVGSLYTFGPYDFRAFDSVLHVNTGQVSILSEYSFGPSNLRFLGTTFVMGPDGAIFFDEKLKVSNQGVFYKGNEVATTDLVNLLLVSYMSLLEKEDDAYLLPLSG